MKRISRVLIVLVPLALLALVVSRVQPAADRKQTKPADNTPSWIWVDAKATSNQVVFFRKSFRVPGRCTGVKLYGTCDDQMTVFCNGQRVLQSNNWQEPVFIDLVKKTRRGNNVLAVRARNGSQTAGLLLKLVIESADHPTSVIVTDSTWKVSTRAVRGWQQVKFKDSSWANAKELARLGEKPWPSINADALASAAKLRKPTATPIDRLKVAKGFQVELLYTVPKNTQGSWVSMTVDDKGRLITSDQYGKLYRVTPSAPGKKQDIQVEPIPVEVGSAQGLLWAFNSLYVMVNKGGRGRFASGLYRVRDTNNDDQLDEVTKIRDFAGAGEHGPHAVLLGPDRKSLYVLAGNHTNLTPIDTSRVPRIWSEDQLLPRMWDATGHAKGKLAPGGWICKTDPEGKKWELISIGYRNEYDAAFNRHGELFTYDSDMEWDMSTPWYRPTRVCHAVSGSDFGWRSGTGKFPTYYADTLPAVVNIGPGSPTGVGFGYGAKFPRRYQEALYLCDWSYGKLYAVHMKPEGASYTGEAEEFITGTPLPLTDMVINPRDGAMYFTIGGRRATSGLYRVTYTGKEPTARARAHRNGSGARAIRHKLEQFHGKKRAEAVKVAWPYLGHADRFIRHAARLAIEHQDPKTWQERALKEKDPQAALTALVALARTGAKSLQPRLLQALDRLQWGNLSQQQKLELLRAYGLAFSRMGKPSVEVQTRIASRFDPHYPAKSRELNSELCKLLVYLQAPSVAAKTIPLLKKALTQEEQLDFALSLRVLKTGWTPQLREYYFRWFLKAANYRGGHSFRGFVHNIKKEAVANLPAEAKVALKPILEAEPTPPLPPGTGSPRKFVKQWKVEDLVPVVERGLKGRDFDRGRGMFAAAQCFACHRFAGEGGAQGPDLTGVAGRYNVRDLLESIIEPSKTISDQYQSMRVLTTRGKLIEGRIVNLSGDLIWLNTNMLDPDAITRIDRKQIETLAPSKVSMMPKNLLDTFKEDEILDLLAYLLSRGDRHNKMFK